MQNRNSNIVKSPLIFKHLNFKHFRKNEYLGIKVGDGCPIAKSILDSSFNDAFFQYLVRDFKSLLQLRQTSQGFCSVIKNVFQKYASQIVLPFHFNSPAFVTTNCEQRLSFLLEKNFSFDIRILADKNTAVERLTELLKGDWKNKDKVIPKTVSLSLLKNEVSLTQINDLSTCFPSLKKLQLGCILNNTEIGAEPELNWKDAFPNLTELTIQDLQCPLTIESLNLKKILCGGFTSGLELVNVENVEIFELLQDEGDEELKDNNFPVLQHLPQFSNLKTLCFSSIKDTSHLQCLPNLESLELLSIDDPLTVDSLNLKRIKCSGCIDGLLTLKNLTNLEILELPQCAWIGDNLMLNCPNLKTLKVRSIIKFEGMKEVMKGIPNLENLETRIDSDTLLPESFLNLRNLLLADCSTEMKLVGLTALEVLKFLYPIFNEAKHISLTLQDLPNLKNLDLATNIVLDSLILGDLPNLTDLRFVEIQQMQDSESLKKLRSLGMQIEEVKK